MALHFCLAMPCTSSQNNCRWFNYPTCWDHSIMHVATYTWPSLLNVHVINADQKIKHSGKGLYISNSIRYQSSVTKKGLWVLLKYVLIFNVFSDSFYFLFDFLSMWNLFVYTPIDMCNTLTIAKQKYKLYFNYYSKLIVTQVWNKTKYFIHISHFPSRMTQKQKHSSLNRHK